MEIDELITNHPVKIIADDDKRYGVNVIERLSAKISIGQVPDNLETPCLEWIGYKDRAGYGKIKIEGESKSAHRVAWEASSRIELPSDVYVCHHCDNPSCINPTHMFPGTSTENNHDMMEKGRFIPAPGRPKLTEEKVKDIRDNNMTAKEAALKYPEVKIRNLRDVVAGRTWKEVK